MKRTNLCSLAFLVAVAVLYLGAIPVSADNTCLMSTYPLRLTNHHYAYGSTAHTFYVLVEGGGWRAVRVWLSGHAATCGYHTYASWSVSVSSSLPYGSALSGNVSFQRSDGKWYRHPTPFGWNDRTRWPSPSGDTSFLMELGPTQYPTRVKLTYSAHGSGWASLPKTLTCTLGYQRQSSYYCTG